MVKNGGEKEAEGGDEPGQNPAPEISHHQVKQNGKSGEEAADRGHEVLLP